MFMTCGSGGPGVRVYYRMAYCCVGSVRRLMGTVLVVSGELIYVVEFSWWIGGSLGILPYFFLLFLFSSPPTFCTFLPVLLGRDSVSVLGTVPVIINNALF